MTDHFAHDWTTMHCQSLIMATAESVTFARLTTMKSYRAVKSCQAVANWYGIRYCSRHRIDLLLFVIYESGPEWDALV
jgi:hypothetical protein